MKGLFLPFLVACLAFWSQFFTSNGLTMFAPFNAIGLVGNITFIQDTKDSPTSIAIYLNPVKSGANPANYSWKLMTYPYHLDTKCSEEVLGKVEKDLGSAHGPIQIPNPPNNANSFTDRDISLFDRKTIWLSSIIIKPLNGAGPVACSNILVEGPVKTARAQFVGPTFGGTITFRENENGDTVIWSQLTYVEDEFRTTSKHDWKILTTDILDRNSPSKDKCSYLNTILDPENQPDGNCTTIDHKKCKIGDLTKKHGQIVIITDNGRGTKQKFIDTNLPLAFFDSFRLSYIVIYEKNAPDKVLSCAHLSLVHSKEAKATFDMDGVKGDIGFSQAFNTDPTIVTLKLNHLNSRGSFFNIHQFPVEPKIMVGEDICSSKVLGTIYNPFKITKRILPSQGSTDQYAVGDLSGKYGTLLELDNETYAVYSIHIDMNLPLFGRHSILGRSLAIQRPDESNWICATIRNTKPMVTAVTTFHFPIAGRIMFQQEINEPSSETSVYVDLAYSDGVSTDTTDHAWHVHIEPPGVDWYNWTERCLSVKGHYNPGRVGLQKYNNCNPNNPFRCELGDLVKKAGEKIAIASYKGSKLVKLFYTDPVLPLAGPYSIIDRSIVVHDEKGPVQRGNRLACAKIVRHHGLAAAARNWRTANAVSPVHGSITFTQNTVYDGSFVHVDFHGLGKRAGGYHVHVVSVPIDRAFPCADGEVQGHFDPFRVGSNVTIYPGVGTTDQYEIGDISGKSGTLAKMDSYRHAFSDHNLPLFGIHSIIGRSIVIHKVDDGARWVCASIEAEIRADEGKEIIALATFDDPRHLVSGYVRFRQFRFYDGSLSDTWIDVDLKHSGTYNRNITNDHKWEVFVNQVGAEAYQPTESVRCLGGGYTWNPLQTARDDKQYKEHCSPQNPLRCQLGDLTGRHGFLEIGGKRKLYTDINLPLVGPNSIVDRSLIIFSKGDNSVIKMACANIKLDNHQELTISLRNTPTFTIDKFMNHMRKQLRTTEWLVVADTQSLASILNDECLTMSVHFYGQRADKLNEAFHNLVQFGAIQYSDDHGTYKLTTPYTTCTPSLAEGVSASSKTIVLSTVAIVAAVFGLAMGAFILRRNLND